MESERVPSIADFLAALEKAAPRWPMTMGWIDCLSGGGSMGRGILMAGRWALPDEAPADVPRLPRSKRMPIDLPDWALNPLTARAFNTAYYWKHLRRHAKAVTSPEPFFYPLDAVHEWNRAYGSRGFTQYQCVSAGRRGGRRAGVHGAADEAGRASPLCVIKDCGEQGQGSSRSRWPGRPSPSTWRCRPASSAGGKLNEFVIATGGRIDLTKDRFTRPEHFRAMEPRLEKFASAGEVGPAASDPQRAVGPHPRGPRLKAVMLGGTTGMGRAIAQTVIVTRSMDFAASKTIPATLLPISDVMSEHCRPWAAQNWPATP